MSNALLTAMVLLLLEGLFALRVAGQLLVLRRAPAWLPPMEQWASGLLPYRVLLGIQAVTLLLMTAVAVGIAQGWPAITEPRPTLGSLLVVVASVYALAMLVRYAFEMARHPEQRWLGGTIPIAFHLVLASWLLVLGVHFRP